jgi:hypothetical protein
MRLIKLSGEQGNTHQVLFLLIEFGRRPCIQHLGVIGVRFLAGLPTLDSRLPAALPFAHLGRHPSTLAVHCC